MPRRRRISRRWTPGYSWMNVSNRSAHGAGVGSSAIRRPRQTSAEEGGDEQYDEEGRLEHGADEEQGGVPPATLEQSDPDDDSLDRHEQEAERDEPHPRRRETAERQEGERGQHRTEHGDSGEGDIEQRSDVHLARRTSASPFIPPRLRRTAR